MVSGTLFHSRRNSWPADDYVQKPTLQLLDPDHGAPPQQAWRRKLNEHANILKEFSVTFMEALKMVRLGFRLWTYVKEERSHGRKPPIDPFTREHCKPSASQGVPLGGMGSGSICRGFRGEFRHWQMMPGMCEPSPVTVFAVLVIPKDRFMILMREGSLQIHKDDIKAIQYINQHKNMLDPKEVEALEQSIREFGIDPRQNNKMARGSWSFELRDVTSDTNQNADGWHGEDDADNAGGWHSAGDAYEAVTGWNNLGNEGPRWGNTSND